MRASRKIAMATTLPLFLCATFVVTAAAMQQGEFAIATTEWSKCRRINETVQCYRTRDSSCRRERDSALAPWYYCEHEGREKPSQVEACAEDACVLDCVVTAWSEWSSCDCSGGFYRTRSRDVAFPPLNGGKPCPALAERELCECPVNLTTTPRNYTWRTGVWGECAPLSASKECGVGVRSRSVECVDSRGVSVSVSNCLSVRAYANVLPPAVEQVCQVPCPCKVSVWSDWTDCEAACDAAPAPHGVQSRQRKILQQPSISGSCPPTEETLACDADISSCPQLAWEVSEWTECTLRDNAICGVGLQRRFIYCIESSNDSNSSSITDEQRCRLQLEHKPETVLPCEVSCPEDCVVGHWSVWTQCPVTCETAYTNRTREVIVLPLAGGSACPHILETSECPTVPCAQWAVADFSECFPSYVPDSNSNSPSCGDGEQSRSVSCVDPHGGVLDQEECSQLPQPERGAACYVPCSDDCVVTEWTSWSECSITCGGERGTRVRTREIVVYGSSPCLFGDNYLTEVQNCTVGTLCENPSYHIEVSDWSECVALDTTASGVPPTFLNAEEESLNTCGTGVHNRTFVCLRNGEVIQPEDCPLSFQLMESTSCDIPCPVDCLVSAWSEFSPCSAACGGGEMRRSLRVLQPPLLGGEECPEEVDTDTGIQLEVISCQLQSCLVEYSWLIDSWSQCHILPTILSRHTDTAACGLGYMNRTVSCIDVINDGMVDDHLCLKLSGDMPSRLQSCVEPCPDRCTVTEWTEFTPCSAGVTTRTREVKPFRDSSDWVDDCPELVDMDMFQAVPCVDSDSTRYVWSITGVWTECILELPSATCGAGFEYRSLACVDEYNPDRPVSEEYCAGQQPHKTKRPCSIVCTKDCKLSDWSDWSDCSTTCGWGYQTRSRESQVVGEPEGDDRCGPLSETNVCYHSQHCHFAEWKLGPISFCRPLNKSTTCGDGYETQEYVCVLDGIVQPDVAACSGLPPAPPPRNFSCQVPCDGECVLGPWSPWTECPKTCTSRSCSQQRTRQKLREECSESATQQRQCPVYVNYFMWQATPWTSCIPMASGNADYCGNGTQNRAVECVDTRTNKTITDDHCWEAKEGETPTLERPASIQSCEIPCPVDCQVGTFSPWSVCPDNCDFNSQQNRSRDVLVLQYNGGRECPSLEQERPCLPICDRYAVEAQNSYCSSEFPVNSTCGSQLSTTPLTCRRNNRFLPLSDCIGGVHAGLDVEGTELLVASHDDCDWECPIESNCSYLPWTSWGECQSSCDVEGEIVSVRTRALVYAFNDTRPQCLSEQYDLKPCEAVENTTCVGFYWATSEWDESGRREVWCQDGEGTEVSPSGCVPAIKPAALQSTCQTSCGEFASCNADTNVCECSARFEMVDSTCLPIQGCVLDIHCLYSDTFCNKDTLTCACTDNRELRDGECIATPTDSTPTDPTHSTPSDDITDTTTDGTGNTIPMPTTVPTTATNSPNGTTVAPPPDVEDPTAKPGDSGSSVGILPIVLVSCVPLLIVIVTTVVLILITYKCRKQLEKRSTKTRKTPETFIQHPTPRHGDGEEEGGRRGAESASSGFVEDIDNELLKYGMAGRTFRDSQGTGLEMGGMLVREATPPANIYPVNVPIPKPYGVESQQYGMGTEQYGMEAEQRYVRMPLGPAQGSRRETQEYGMVGSQHSGMVMRQDPQRYQGYEMEGMDYGAESQGDYGMDSQLSQVSQLSQGGYGNDLSIESPRLIMPSAISSSVDSHLSGHPGRGGLSVSEELAHGRSGHAHSQPHPYNPHSHAQAFHYPPPSHHHHTPSGHLPSRDDRIATGLDGSMVRAIEQLTGTSAPTTGSGFERNRAGSRRSGRRSGRRRQYSRTGTYPGRRHPHPQPLSPGPYQASSAGNYGSGQGSRPYTSGEEDAYRSDASTCPPSTASSVHGSPILPTRLEHVSEVSTPLPPSPPPPPPPAPVHSTYYDDAVPPPPPPHATGSPAPPRSPNLRPRNHHPGGISPLALNTTSMTSRYHAASSVYTTSPSSTSSPHTPRSTRTTEVSPFVPSGRSYTSSSPRTPQSPSSRMYASYGLPPTLENW